MQFRTQRESRSAAAQGAASEAPLTSTGTHCRGAVTHNHRGIVTSPVTSYLSSRHLSSSRAIVEGKSRGAVVRPRSRCVSTHDYTLVLAMADTDKREVLRGVAEQVLDRMFKAFTSEQWSAVLQAPLASAAGEGDEGLVQKLVEAGAHIGDAVHAAIRGGHGEIVDTLVENGGSIHQPDADGDPPLHVAAGFGEAEILRSLLLKGADKDSWDAFDCTALYRAALWGHVDTVDALMIAGAQVLAISGQEEGSAIHAAAREGHVGVLRVLIDRGTDVRITDSRGKTALHFAETEEMVDMLVEAGADVHARTDDGSTSLHYAADRHNCETVLALLKHGAEVNAKDDDEATPLHLGAFNAGFECSAPVVDLLLRNGADETIVETRLGRTAEKTCLTYTDAYSITHRERVCKLLRDAPADRAWRRRGFLVMCRAHRDRLSGIKESTATDDDMPMRCGRQAVAEETGCRWNAVAARLVGFEEEGIFRTAVGYL